MSDAAGSCRRETGPRPTGEWFVVLPDDRAAASLIGAPVPDRTLRHPSGRPWLVGDWDSRDLRTGEAGPVRLAVLGTCSVDDAALSALAGRIRHPADVARVCAHLPGSFHLIASVDGVAVVRGTLSGIRRVYRARVGRCAVGADRADVLGALLDAPVDEQRLAVRLLVLTDTLPMVDDTDPLWPGVSAVPAGSLLRLPRGGGATVERYWTPPAAQRSLAEGAADLRAALDAAVRVRTGIGRSFSADLSGGLDSTSICWLAGRAGHRFTTFTTDSGDPRDDDPRWAALAAEQLAPARRIVAAVSDLPMHYADLFDELPALDEPFPGIGDRAEYRAIGERLRAAGSELHLTGDGGDEVVTATPSYLPEVLRRRPGRALAHLRAYRAHGRWSVRTTLRAVWPTEPRALLLRNADSLAARLPDTAGLPRDESPVTRAYLPPWATPDTVEAVRATLRAAAERLGDPSGGAAQDEALRGIAYSGHVTRCIGQFTGTTGVPITAPFLDDHVIEACLAVRPDLRADPWRYKPLLTEAMRGIVPAPSLARTSKADGASLAFRSIREHRDKLLALCEGSALARLGVIDVEPLRQACSTSLWASDLTPIAFSSTFSCERWLRDLQRGPTVAPAALEPHRSAR